MAIAYLNEGATSLAAANWSDTTGFADAATLIINKPGSQSIQTALDQSGVNKSINYLDVLTPFSGVIGGTGGSLLCDVDGAGGYNAASQLARLKVESGTVYFKAQGTNSLCHILMVGGSGRVFATGGTVNHFHAYGGQYNISDSVIFGSGGEVWLTGGTGTIESHASDLLDTVNVTGGSHTIKRGFTATTGTLNIEGGTVTLDLGTAACPNIYVRGGTLIWVSAAAPDTADLYLRSGVLDLSKINTAVSIDGYTDAPSCQVVGYGNPKFVLGGTRVPIGTGARFVS